MPAIRLGTAAVEKAYRGAAELSQIYIDGVGLFADTGPVNLVFEALVPDPTTYEMLGVKTGTGGLTVGRAADINLADKDGVYRTFGSGESGYEGGRVTGVVGSRVVYASDDGGQPLADLPTLVHAPEATNLNLYARDLSVWSTAQTTHSFVAGIDGTIYASRIDDQDAGAAQRNQSESPAHTAVDGEEVSVVFFVNRLSSQTVYGEFQVVASGGTLKAVYFKLDQTDGSYFARTETIAQYTISVIAESADWWRVVLTYTVEAGNSHVRLSIYPAAGDAINSAQPAASFTGSIDVDAVCFFDKTSHAQAKILPPIYTDGAAVTRPVDVYSFDEANHSDVQGVYYLEYKNVSQEVTTLNVLSLTSSSSTGMFVDFRSSGQLRACTGVATSALVAFDSTDWNRIATVYETGSSLQVNAEGVYGGETAYNGSWANNLSALALNAKDRGQLLHFRDLRFYDASFVDGKAKIDELMA